MKNDTLGLNVAQAMRDEPHQEFPAELPGNACHAPRRPNFGLRN